MRRIITLFVTVVCVSMAVVLANKLLTDHSKYKNDFARIFPPHAADVVSIFKAGSRRFSLSGIKDSVVYLRDQFNRRGVLALSSNMIDTNWIQLDIPRELELSVDGFSFFLQNGNTASLQRGNTRDWLIDTTFADLPGFTAVQPISSNTAILRTINITKRQNLLVKSNQPDGPKYVLKKQVDGILCTDGYLEYSKEYHRLVYTYRYRNQVLVLDTALNVQLTAKTIDTTSVARISVSDTDGKITMAKPPLVVNKETRIDGKYLFVRSNLMARNESPDEFNDRSVIDVYNILDGSYRFSFYIDNYNGSKMKSFQVKDFILIAIFNEAIIRCDLPAKYLP